jgi:hypothetical protein
LRSLVVWWNTCEYVFLFNVCFCNKAICFTFCMLFSFWSFSLILFFYLVLSWCCLVIYAGDYELDNVIVRLCMFWFYFNCCDFVQVSVFTSRLIFIINLIDFAMILWSCYEFMCSGRRVDSCWSCKHHTHIFAEDQFSWINLENYCRAFS